MFKKWHKILTASFMSLALLAACGTSADKDAGKDEAKDDAGETYVIGIFSVCRRAYI